MERQCHACARTRYYAYMYSYNLSFEYNPANITTLFAIECVIIKK
jgi:hypothetical protein